MNKFRNFFNKFTNSLEKYLEKQEKYLEKYTGKVDLIKRILIPINVFAFVLFTLSATYMITKQYRAIKTTVDESTDHLVAFLMSSSVSTALVSLDGMMVEVFVKEALKFQNFSYIVVNDPAGNPLSKVSEKLEGSGIVHKEKEIKNDSGAVLGRVLYGYNYGNIAIRIALIVLENIVIAAILQFVISTILLVVLRRAVEPIGRIREMLLQSSLTNEKTSGSLKSSSDSINTASSQQASAIQESVSAISEVGEMISQTTQYADQLNQESKSVKIKTEEGLVVISDLSDTMNRIAESQEQLKNIMVIINEISQKTKVINDIVFQTKLLSFNASVEAARAGEHGKGFSVVAEEVGKLAALSGSASKEINDLLKNSVERVEQVIRAVQDKIAGGNEVKLKVSRSFDEISKNVLNMTQKITQISVATKEQEVGINETNKALRELDKSSHENMRSASELAQVALEADSEAHKIKTIASDLESIVGTGT